MELLLCLDINIKSKREIFKMKLLALLVICIAAYAQAQFFYIPDYSNNNPNGWTNGNYLRSSYESPSSSVKAKLLIGGNQYITISTSTFTTTFTSVTTCTTSTSALSACVPSAKRRRRRGAPRQSLYYEEGEGLLPSSAPKYAYNIITFKRVNVFMLRNSQLAPADD